MTGNAIHAQDLAYSYGETNAVNGISFDVARGEIIGFLGPNGAGKTTTIKMLTGQLVPKSGKIEILGMDVVQSPNKVQEKIGVSFETTNLYEQMTAEENLKLFARLFSVKGFDANALLRRVGLDGRGKEQVKGYSKGMKQRLMVARSLIHKPDILFLDEPTEGLDPVSSEMIRSIVREETQRGATVFLTTHDMHEADVLSHKVAFINHGKIVALDTPHELKQQYGERILQAEVKTQDGQRVTKEILMDTADTSAQVQTLFDHEQVITVHTKEASLEDIFIQITGRGLVG